MSARSLAELVASPAASVEDLALAIARDACPSLDEDAAHRTLDGLADRVVDRLERDASVHDQVEALRAVLVEEHGLRGNEDDYYDPRNSYLHEVLARRLGIPITLSVVVLGVARRAGIVADGIGFPSHFLARIGGPAGVVVDAFRGLERLDRAELTRRARRLPGMADLPLERLLAVVDRRAIAIRILSNLQSIHEQRGDHGRALVVCDRLVELDAGAAARRDRGLHALALGGGASARDDLAAYLAERPRANDAARVRDALDRAAARTVVS
jgi:regulator of sirC expression with transglutaminase-like and TPR domain